MAAGTADVGTGITITFATATNDDWAAELLSVEHGDVERPAIDTTHLGTTGGRTFIPGNLYDPGTITCECAFLPDDPPRITHTAETITITWPLGSGGTPANTQATGFITGYTRTGSLEEKMTANVTIKVSGSITDTAETV